jgi:hypothetical protein
MELMELPIAAFETEVEVQVRPMPAGPSGPRRHVLGLVARAGLLGGLAYLTFANATDSPSLREAIEAEFKGDYPAAVRSATDHLARRPWSFEASRIIARCLSRLDFAERAEP